MLDDPINVKPRGKSPYGWRGWDNQDEVAAPLNHDVVALIYLANLTNKIINAYRSLDYM